MSYWKTFCACLLIGLVTAFGLRATMSAAPEPEKPAMKMQQPPPKGTGLLIDLGNQKCPIGGDAVDGTTYGEWNNLRVGFCCPGCDTRFLKEPEASLEKMGIEWRELSVAVARYHAAPSAHKQHELAALRKRWNVIREP
ncbi:MAG: hypothetical protein ACYTEG_00990 [Planctomycetota bacterium]|jgi:hypothetical protein